MPTVFVIGSDWTLRAGVRAELREMGVEALGFETLDDAAQVIAQGSAPDAVVVDAPAAGEAAAEMTTLARRVPVLVVASRTAPAPALEHVAAVLYRPISIGEVAARVRKLLEGQPA